MEYRSFSSCDNRFSIYFEVNFEHQEIAKLHSQAISKRCYFDHAFNRISLDASIYENKAYYPQGYIVFDMDSLAIWSFKNLLAVARFIKSRSV